MIRSPQGMFRPELCIPRESGDDPWCGVLSDTAWGYSPRERG